MNNKRDTFTSKLREDFREDHDGRLRERGLGDFTNEYVYWLEELLFDEHEENAKD